MANKLVHVNAYERDDGTKVREHYRGGGHETTFVPRESNPVRSNDDFGSSDDGIGFGKSNKSIFDILNILGVGIPNVSEQDLSNGLVLEGGVYKNEYYPFGDNGTEGDVMGQAGEAVQAMMILLQTGLSLAEEGVKIAQRIKGIVKGYENLEEGNEELLPLVGRMRSTYESSVELETRVLDKLVKTKNQREYTRLYESYQNQRMLNRETEGILNRLEYGIEKGNTGVVSEELENYQTVQKEGLTKAVRYNLQQMPSPQPNGIDYPMPQPLTPSNPLDWKELRRTGLHNYPELQKNIIGIGMKIFGINALDARKLWRIAVEDVKGYEKYVDRNGTFVESISELPFEFKDTIRAKVKEQLHVDDARGLILRPDSGLSQEIAQSREFQDFVKTHLSELLRGETVSGSACFDSSNNLHLTLKKADIIDTYINKNGDMVSFVLDTYDFNANDPDWKVEWAHNVQEKGLLSDFYSLILVVIPKEEWLKWFLGL